MVEIPAHKICLNPSHSVCTSSPFIKFKIHNFTQLSQNPCDMKIFQDLKISSNIFQCVIRGYSRKSNVASFSCCLHFNSLSLNRDRQAVRQEFIFVKRRSSLVCSSLIPTSLFCLSSIFAFMNLSLSISDPKLVVCEKIT